MDVRPGAYLPARVAQAGDRVARSWSCERCFDFPRQSFKGRVGHFPVIDEDGRCSSDASRLRILLDREDAVHIRRGFHKVGASVADLCEDLRH